MLFINEMNFLFHSIIKMEKDSLLKISKYSSSTYVSIMRMEKAPLKKLE